MWSNWAGNQQCTPSVVEHPARIEDVVAAVHRAKEAGRRVRVAGAGHSFTGAVLTDGVLLSLDHMAGLLGVDSATGQVRVQAGMTLHALSGALSHHGLALENLGDIDVQSVAGAISTGTHGTGATLRNLSAAVEAVQVVVADGTVLELDAQTDPEAWRAARVAIGACGVITELTLRCVPAFTLRGVDAPMPLDDVLDAIDEHVDGHQHFEFFVFPHADMALTRTNEPVDEPARPRSSAHAWAQDMLLTNHAFHAMSALGRAVPSAIPSLNRLATRSAGTSVRVDRSDRIFATPRTVPFVEMEYAIPRAACASFLRAIRAEIDHRGFAVNFPIEVRFVAPDDAFLSPAGGRATCYVAVHMYRGMEHEPYFRAVEALADGHDGRPHWGKLHFQDATTLAPRYPDWERFQTVRARLDPEGRFANEYTDRVFGATPQP